ncbi:MAG: DUF11 domain-containing protein [Gammaproteobacteria bacterium]|nr:DUF11 domain-containing protein [Gammaproteobacteria bacterium]MBU0849422.1 DUF11 domain-containing protein [Gammaproteobacteria bacterium]MBU1266573.1 DUF11 domain-containing protein [Gammaproteobacteria bacterium]MBU1527770.1 DUF11 domain-containing protein [Gammaproteobacteria bacterium]MBU1779557.1 DUF11 domain-containing protein [Gammaproteobacteria bacterium]
MRYTIICCLFVLMITAPARVQAECRGDACVSMGSNLASVDSSQSALLGGVLSNLTGSDISFSSNESSSLAQGDVDLETLLQNIENLSGADSTAAALGSEITLSQFYAAAADAANAAGDSDAAVALSNLSSEVAGVPGTFQLGELIALQESEGGYDGVNLNALELVSGSAEVFSGNNPVATSEPVTISGSELGMAGVVNSVTIASQVVEPARIVCGPEGSTFHSASMRYSLSLDLVDTSLDMSSLLALPGIADVEASIGQLNLYVEVSRAEGVIQSIDALNQAITINATPGVTDMYLGQFPEGDFFNTSVSLDPALLDFSTIGSVTVSELSGTSTTVSIQAKSSAQGEQSFVNTLLFNGPYPETQRSSTSADAGSQLLDSLMSNLVLQLSPEDLGLINDQVLAAVQDSSSDTLPPLLSSALTGVVDPMMESMGTSIGEVDTTVHAVRQVCDFSGLVYHDLNHDYINNTGDGLCNEALYVKLVSSDTPTGPALAVATVEPSTGQYTFTTASAGNYSLVLDTNNDLNDVVSTAPTGWLHMESEDGVQPLLVEPNGATGSNFGVYHGSTLSGFVFEDNGAGVASAHDGVFLNDEAGLDGIVVKLTDGATTALLGEVITQGGGAYRFWISAGVGGSVLTVVQTNRENYRSISASVGNTGGTYDQAQDRISFARESGKRYESLDFGDVKTSAMYSDNQRSSVAGSPVFYPHVFVAGSEGEIAFEVRSDSVSQESWQSVLYRDSNCDGQLDTSEEIIAAPVNVQADEKLCLLMKMFVPLAAPADARHVDTLLATFTYSNTTVDTAYAVNNVTTVGSSDSPGLTLLKQVEQPTALPGETLVYTVRYENQGAGDLNALEIHDSTPAYTVFSSAQCVDTPADLRCEVSEQPDVGDSGGITWKVIGLVPPGTSGVVRFSVVVQ